MPPSAWIQICGLLITLLLFLIPIVYFAGKLVGKIETLITRIGGLETKVDGFSKECFTKSAAAERINEANGQRDAMWHQIDKLKKLVGMALFKLGINPATVEESKKD